MVYAQADKIAHVKHEDLPVDVVVLVEVRQPERGTGADGADLFLLLCVCVCMRVCIYVLGGERNECLPSSFGARHTHLSTTPNQRHNGTHAHTHLRLSERALRGVERVGHGPAQAELHDDPQLVVREEAVLVLIDRE